MMRFELTNKDQVLSRRKEFFEQHLNNGAAAGGGVAHNQPSDLVELRDDGVKIDLLSRKEIHRALNILKNNKAAGLNWVAAERL
jgi:hypothetical protein